MNSIEGAVIVRSASSGLKVAAGTVGTMGEIAAGGLFEAAMSDRVSPMTAVAAMARGETSKRLSRSRRREGQASRLLIGARRGNAGRGSAVDHARGVGRRASGAQIGSSTVML